MMRIPSNKYWMAIPILTTICTATHAMEERPQAAGLSGFDLELFRHMRAEHLHLRDELNRERAKASRAEERAHKATEERHQANAEAMKHKVEIASLHRRIKLWRVPGLLFFVVALPLAGHTTYCWLKKRGYLGHETNEHEETNQLIENTEINEEVPTIEKVG